VKATLVILIFMGVRWSSRLTWVVAASGFVWLLILFGITMSDYLSRGCGSCSRPTSTSSADPGRLRARATIEGSKGSRLKAQGSRLRAQASLESGGPRL